MAPKKQSNPSSTSKNQAASKNEPLKKIQLKTKKANEEIIKSSGFQGIKGANLNNQQPKKQNQEEQKNPQAIQGQKVVIQSKSLYKTQPINIAKEEQTNQNQKGNLINKQNQESESKNDQQIKELQEENKNLKTQVQNMEQKLESSNYQYEQLEQSTQLKEKKLEEKLEQQKQNIANNEVKELKQKISQQAQTLKDKEEQIKKLKENQEKVENEKGSQQQKLKQSQKEEQNKIQEMKSQIEKIQKELENQTSLTQKKEQEKNSISDRKEQLEKQVKDLQQQLIEKDQEMMKLTQEVKQKQSMPNAENKKILNSSAQGSNNQELSNQAPIQLKQIYPRRNLTSLKEEYQHNENIKQIIDQLCQTYNAYRNVRGDGNCYFRAVGFSFLEHLVRITTLDQHLADLINNFESNKGYFQVRPGTEDNQFNHFNIRQIFLKLLKNLQIRKQRKDKNILQYLEQELQNNKENQDEALIWEMRSITANYLEYHKVYFQPFCQIPYEEIIQNVLMMGKEADGIGIGPLQVVLKVKIEIVTIGRQYTEALSFEQMKIAGKLPQIFILFKPGHYDILYTNQQSDADGFNEKIQDFSKEKKPPFNYNIDYPGFPFFVEIQPNGQESPCENFKEFNVQYIIDYIGTEQNAQFQQSNQQQDLNKQPQVQQCSRCQLEIDIQDFIQFKCFHQACKYCLEDWLNLKLGGKLIPKNQEGGNKIVCMQCTYILEDEEIEKILGKEKYNEALNKGKRMKE